ncbi:hypothetical protein [Allorhizocola rhizosphaerae]|uniref:hypothetical protein n=1 Tax=Allorhizocola rhizosphaerae TaxID=1872709 RepID=UPI000E3DD57C|nr:hypothetical protein [Allorhizocola rhizosphaerae]
MAGTGTKLISSSMALTTAILLAVGGSGTVGASTTAIPPFEVWLVDQSDTAGLGYGGTLRVYDGRDLTGPAPSQAVPTDVVDLGAETAGLCRASTGADPVRPHMLTFNWAETHAALSFVASGHVVFLDARNRRPLACVRTEPGTGGARQAHAIWPSRDDRYLMVANQNGKKMERFRTDYQTGSFVQEPAATVDLAACTTPNGAPCQAAGIRPDNAPICPFIASDNGPLFVSLRGGGMLVLDWRTTPMSIVAEYDLASVPANGCGFTEAHGKVFADGGGGTPANLDQFSVFRLPMNGYAAANPPNVPPVERLFDDDSAGRDAHGSEATNRRRYVWVADRDANVAEVFDGITGARLTTVDLTSAFSADPTPDLFAVSPDRAWFFLSTRGPNPLSGDPHSSHGTDPGMLVVQLTHYGLRGQVRGLVRITNPDATGVERADAHAIRVRRK